MRRFWATVLVGVFAGGLLVALPPRPTTAAAAPAPPIASPAVPIGGERFVVTGKLTTKVVRRVQLQVKVGKKWKQIASGKTDKTGSYSLATSSKASSITVRVVAPKVTIKHKKYKTIITSPRTIRPSRIQSATLTMPTTAQVTEAVNATLVFAPARAGRPVQLEALISGTWTKVATGFETDAGTSVIQLTATTIGTFSYRAAAPAWNGAPAVGSSPSQLTVTASHVSVPDTTRPLTDAEAAAVTSYDAQTGAVVLTNPPSTITSVAAGDAITIPPRDGAASGALRRITKVATSFGATTLSTEEVSLADVIENIPDEAESVGLSLLSSSFEPTDGVTVESTPLASRSFRGAGVRATSLGELKLALDVQAKSDAGLYLKLKGGVSIVPRNQLELKIDWFRLKSYKIGAGVQVNNSVSAEVGLTGKAKVFSQELGVLNQVLYGSIGPVPVWVQITLKLVAEVNVSGTVSVTATVAQTGTTMGGVQSSSDSDLTPKFYTSSAESVSKLVKVTAAGSLDAFVGPQIEIALYSLGGLYGKLGAQAKAELSVNTIDGWKCSLKYGPHAEIEVKTSDAIKKLTGIEFKAGAKVDFTAAEIDVCPEGTGDGGGSSGGDPGSDSPLAITTTSLPALDVGRAYSADLTASGGVTPYSWTATGLPDGLSLTTTGRLAGTVAKPGIYAPTFTLEDAAGTTRSVTIQLDSGLRVVQVSVGGSHSCALTSAGTVECWGSNMFGQLGDATTTDRSVPTPVPGVIEVTQISAGDSHTCALTRTGTVTCWGLNSYGQLGVDSGSSYRATPAAVAGLTGVTQIEAGAGHTCALKSSGTVECWGYNGHGELGNGTTIDTPNPTPVTGLVGITGISVGAYHSCALAEQSVQCWGYNAQGQLGDGTTDNRAIPTGVDGLTGVTQVVAGAWATCAVAGQGSVQCWGSNNYGELGDGSTTQRHSPTPVVGLAATSRIAIGSLHTCALSVDGTVSCWGWNRMGQLGDGTTDARSTPADVTGLAGVVDIGAGAGHSCALTNTGSVECWGYNGYGQLGDGTTTDSLAPVTTAGIG